MSKDLQAENARLKALLEASEAKLAQRASRSAKNVPTFPTVELKDEAGNVTQREVSSRLVSSGGGWYTVAHIGEVVKDGSRVLFLRKYQNLTVKEGKEREGEVAGQKVLRQKANFRINSADHWNAIRALGDECFSPAPEAPAAE